MALPLSDQVIIITGAASGVGRAAAQKLAALGATLCLCDINTPNLQETLQSLSPGSSFQSLSAQQHTTYTLDVSSPAACTATAETIRTHHTHITGLRNCAGINPTALPLPATSDTYIATLMSTNLLGTIYMSRACLPYIPRGGTIINIASDLGLRGADGMSIYCAAKFGVVGFTKALALEVGSAGVRVNAVAPGPVDTPTMWGNVVGDSGYNDKVKQKIGLGRLGKPEEVASVVGFLFGEEAGFVNGGVWEVNGGL
ncbi:hypothetical protein ASPACDRAFT_35131 [Aspergillus aculeatus ATCC 16872]|uniref:Uncharacterized protein n=1 Tax=Aspergillus aculeatus (strain ATCC 16872 / CBS 172.66 / WB 5094) TaxID=690307 RepID=A0A1L9WIV6_ASPA1|nr:uncharacterized protein ASPACDRAFT_35131 [Aspergillus aculeatus ATCC 16872]OJJ96045.1 hypothetical protein ASPACDRAFT_35131 [Aspergillus aculeatus ATCC 16872]